MTGLGILWLITITMARIVDICFIKGRRRQAIEQEKAEMEFTGDAIVRKLAKHRYDVYVMTNRKEGRKIETFKYWATHSYENQSDEITKLFQREECEEKLRAEWKSYGEKVRPNKVEVSLEQQILDLLNDGWVLKGEIIPADKEWVQTMVKYESNNNEDLLGLQSIESEKNTFIPEGSEEENEYEDEDEDEHEDADK